MSPLATLVVLAQLSPGPARPLSECLTDGIGAGLSTAAGGALGVVAGVRLGGALADNSGETLGYGLLLGAVLGASGILGGGAAFHELSDGDGDLYASMIGAFGGVLVGVSITEQVQSVRATFITMAVTTALGAGLGYAVFDDDSVTPSALMLPDGEGGFSANLGLLGSF